MKKVIAASSLAALAVALVNCSDPSIAPADRDYPSAIRNTETGTTQSTESTLVPYHYESLDNGTVKLSFENLSGDSIRGDVIREGVSYQQNGTILHAFSVANGGSHTFVDDRVIPGETYRYVFEYKVGDTFGFVINFDTVDVVSTVPALGNFLLLPPDGGESYDFLFDGQTIDLSHANIVVETDDDRLTRSVVFNLNGTTYTDNRYPFTLFPEGTADLQNGSYVLTAIAYPKKKGRGVPGDTATVSFMVNNIY